MFLQIVFLEKRHFYQYHCKYQEAKGKCTQKKKRSKKVCSLEGNRRYGGTVCQIAVKESIEEKGERIL